MGLVIEMVGEMIHIRCEGENGQFYAPVSQSEYEAIQNMRAIVDVEMITEQNEKSSNQKAVEELDRLSLYLRENTNFVENISGNPVDCIIEMYDYFRKLPKSGLDDYQLSASKTAIYPGKGTPLGLIYCALKLSGEAGEVADNVGKALRDDGLSDHLDYPADNLQLLNPNRRSKLKLELGDVLWYVSQAAKELEFTLEEIAQANLDKLAARKDKGTLQGSGDDR